LTPGLLSGAEKLASLMLSISVLEDEVVFGEEVGDYSTLAPARVARHEQ
jgi:hypothetical protein